MPQKGGLTACRAPGKDDRSSGIGLACTGHRRSSPVGARDERRRSIRFAARRAAARRALLLHRGRTPVGRWCPTGARAHSRDHARRRAHDRVPRHRARIMLGGDRWRAAGAPRARATWSCSRRATRTSCPARRACARGRSTWASTSRPRPPQLPFSLSASEQGVTTAQLDGGGRERATVVCGFLGCDARPFNPLLASLPRVLHMPGLARERRVVGRSRSCARRSRSRTASGPAARRCSSA